MKKSQLITMMLFMMLTTVSFGQDNQIFKKQEELVKNLYAGTGWDITMFYNVDSEGNSVSDTTYYVFVNSAKYTQIKERYTLCSTNNYNELLDFFKLLNNSLQNMPNESGFDNNDYHIHIYKSNKSLIVTKTDTNRDDYYSIYNLMLVKVINKTLLK